jgi:hypothetical protein
VEGSVVADRKHEIALSRRQLTPLQRARDFEDRTIGPIRLVVHELHVFQRNDVVVVVQGIIYEIT